MLDKIFHTWDKTSFYLTRTVYLTVFTAIVIFAASYFAPVLLLLGQVVLLCLALAVGVDSWLLYSKRRWLEVSRTVQDRLSNGDDNRIILHVRSNYDFAVKGLIIDELPFQLQERKWKRVIQLQAGESKDLLYTIRPMERGEFSFGDINVFLQGPLTLVRRRYRFQQEQTVRVYPSYIQMRRYQLHAVASEVTQPGMKRMRKLGHSMEFEQIKEYVRGDDYRTINWKATARKGDLMVNNYTDERSQQVYCLINKGRVMKMPFEGMTLLDYAINASLVISHVALQKHDRAGLITFSQQVDAFLPADKKPTQINQIMERLYKEQTNFLEPDFEQLFSAVRNRITNRSLLVLFTNFESFESLQRELPSLKRLAHYHLLMVVFFENTALKDLIEQPSTTLESVYIKTIAEKYRHEKRLIAKELKAHGIISVLTTPQNLTISALNKYLELKNRQSI